MKINKENLIGVWKLVSCEHRLAGGGIVYPYGRDPIGRLVYTREGFMIVTLMSSRRPRFASGGMFEGRDEEWAAAAREFIAYSGRYELKDGKIVHHVDISLFPNWTGSRQLRTLTRDGSRLLFSTRPFDVRGVRQTAHLLWERA